MNSTNGTNGTNGTDAPIIAVPYGTGVFNGQTNSSNALGYVGPTNYAISVPPYKIKRCDQVLLIPGQRITDMTDYCKKTDAFMTMSVYLINLFDAKDPTKLIESISVDRLNNVPVPLAGSPGCIDFQGKDRRIAFCLKNDDLVQQLIEAFGDLMRCRMGDNLHQLSMNEIRDFILNGCKGDKSKFDFNKFLDPKSNVMLGNKNNLPSITGVKKNSTGVNPYYSDLRVPGS